MEPSSLPDPRYLDVPEGQEIDGSLFGDEATCFACGPHHPNGFHMHFARIGDEVVTHFTPTPQTQGAPSMMHGGLITTVADEIGAWTVVFLRSSFGFTATLECRFKAPVRVGVPIEGRGRITRDLTRLIDVAVDLRQEGKLCWTGKLRFILLDEKGMETMIGGPIPQEWKRFIRVPID